MRLFLLIAIATGGILILANLADLTEKFMKFANRGRVGFMISALVVLGSVAWFVGEVELVQVYSGIAFGFVLWYIADHFVQLRGAPVRAFEHKEYHYWLGGALVLLLLIGLFTHDIKLLALRINKIDFGFASFQLSDVSKLEQMDFSDRRSFVVSTTLNYVYRLENSIELDRLYLESVAPKTHRDVKSGLPKKHRNANIVISGLLAPLAKCADVARINNVDIELIRQKIRPIPRHLKYLLVKKYSKKEKNLRKEEHDEFVKTIREGYEGIRGTLKFVMTPDISEICPTAESLKFEDNKYRKFWIDDPPKWHPDFFIGDIFDEPNLNLVTAILFAFNKNIDAALESFSNKEVTAEFRFNFDYRKSRLLYSTNAEAKMFYPPLERIIEGANKQIREINQSLAKLPSDQQDKRKLLSSLKELKKRATRARLHTKNVAAYYLAQAISSGDRSARKWWHTAQTFAEDILRRPDNLTAIERAAFLDTHAYVRLIVESEKEDLSLDEIKILFVELCKAKEIYENLLEKSKVKDTVTELRRALESVRRHIQLANLWLARKANSC